MNKVGTSNNPITLDDTEDNTTGLLEQARNKSIIDEALFTRQPLDICFAVVKTKINGDLPTKQRQLNKEIINHFKQEININISCAYFHPKLDPDYSDPQTKANPCELLLYGVDFLTTSLIKDRFTMLEAEVREIVWINDSLCKLVYGSPGEAERVIRDQTKVIKMEEQNDQPPHEWHSIKSYTIFSFERLLWIRYATSQEGGLQKEKKGFYDQFAAAKKKLGQRLLIKFNAVDQYKSIVNQLQFEGLRRNNHNRHERPQRDRYRTRQRPRRQFDDSDDNRFKKKKYQPQVRGVQEIRTTDYAHRPVNRDQSFYSKHNNQYRSANNNKREYLDFNPNMNLSFRFNSQKDVNNNKNESFEYKANNNRKRYDVQLDSQLSFNHFGVQNTEKNNEREDYNCDFNFDKDYRANRSELHNNNNSFVYQQRQEERRQQRNNSFAMNNSYRKYNNINNSFNYSQRQSSKPNQDLSFVQNKQNRAGKADEADFFELLNAEVSPIRQANEDLNTSFKYDKKKDSKNNRILNDSFYQQDSY